MDYAKIASQVIELSGGKGNIRSVAHCATRLRLQLRNNDLRNEEAISDVEGVKGVFLTQSQFQIIFGAGLVNLIDQHELKHHLSGGYAGLQAGDCITAGEKTDRASADFYGKEPCQHPGYGKTSRIF